MAEAGYVGFCAAVCAIDPFRRQWERRPNIDDGVARGPLGQCTVTIATIIMEMMGRGGRRLQEAGDEKDAAATLREDVDGHKWSAGTNPSASKEAAAPLKPGPPNQPNSF